MCDVCHQDRIIIEVVDGHLYVRAYNGTSSSWFKSAVKQKAGQIHAAGMTKEVKFEHITDSAANRLIDHAYKKKYSKSAYVAHMVAGKAAAATIKITPNEI